MEDGQRQEVVDRLCWTEFLDASFPSLVPNFRASGLWFVGLSIPQPVQQTACTWDGYMKKVIRAAYAKEVGRLRTRTRIALTSDI